MSSRILRLPESLVRKIAAGEVIERPASVVKELVENAVDAEARRIWIDVVDAGRQSLRIIDDGVGMSREDVELCTERHATSKMRTPTDLFTIDTLGFRGEALASIGAVARLSIETRRADDTEGTRLVVEGGVRRELVPTGRDVGTTVEVQGLFYNTPARRKFLRHNETEVRYLTQTVVQMAAARPEIAFRLRHAEREILDLLPSERHERAADLLSADVDTLLQVGLEDTVEGSGGISVEGMITPPELCRRSRSKQFIIVRQRPIVARTIVQAIYSGYGSLLPAGGHPQLILWLDLDPRQLDVNVHPTKREVRFADEAPLRRLVQEAVRQALRVPEARSFTATTTGTTVAYPTPAFLAPTGVAESTSEPGDTWVASGVSDAGTQMGEDDEQMSLSLLPPTPVAGTSLADDTEGRQALAEARQAGRVWQTHNKYLLLAVRDGLLIVDQHAAHERVRFEEVLDMLAGESSASQQLLMPLTVEVGPVEMAAFRGAGELFAQLGFQVREFGPTTLLVDAIPPQLRNWGEGDLFLQILSDLIDELEARSEASAAMAASMACHTSIRAGERLSQPEMETLIDRLLGAREPFACPHGRPILLKIPLMELDRLFHRS